MSADGHRKYGKGLRLVSPDDVREIRHDYNLRRRAEEMLRLAKDALRVVPTCEDHAKRVGISGVNVRKIARGMAYKDLRS